MMLSRTLKQLFISSYVANPRVLSRYTEVNVLVYIIAAQAFLGCIYAGFFIFGTPSSGFVNPSQLKYYDLNYTATATPTATVVSWNSTAARDIIQDIWSRNSTCPCRYLSPLSNTNPNWYWLLPNNITYLFDPSPYQWCLHQRGTESALVACSRFAETLQSQVNLIRLVFGPSLLSNPDFISLWSVQYRSTCLNVVGLSGAVAYSLGNSTLAKEIQLLWNTMMLEAPFNCHVDPDLNRILLDPPWRDPSSNATMISFDSTIDTVTGSEIVYSVPSSVYQDYVARCNPELCYLNPIPDPPLTMEAWLGLIAFALTLGHLYSILVRTGVTYYVNNDTEFSLDPTTN